MIETETETVAAPVTVTVSGAYALEVIERVSGVSVAGAAGCHCPLFSGFFDKENTSH